MYDYHIHSTHSGDSLAPDRVQILAAAHFGLQELCFTNHLDIDFPYGHVLDFELDIPAFMEDFYELEEEFSPIITLKKGIEVGLQKHILGQLEDRLQGHAFDYILASRHVISMDRDMHRPENWQYHTKQEVLQTYIRDILECIETFDDFNCVGHITYYSRYNPNDDRETHYEDAADEFDELFRLLIQRGQGIEVNTQTYSRYGFFVPDYDIVKRFREMGGEIITTGSDAHLPNRVGANFEEAYAMIKSAGFDHVCTFKDRKPIFNKI